MIQMMNNKENINTNSGYRKITLIHRHQESESESVLQLELQL